MFGLDLSFLEGIAIAEMNEEVTTYLQEFPNEMIFHTSNLHLLYSVGQGKKMCEQICCKLEFILKLLR